MERKKPQESFIPAANKIKEEKIRWQSHTIADEWNWVNYFKEEGDLSLGFKLCEKNAWIVRTLVSKKERFKFKTCKNLILVGSGMYPYSLFDVYKQYPNINLIGLEYNKMYAKISKLLIETAGIQDRIKIISEDGNNFDYSFLGHEDLVFLSVDILSRNEIFNKAIQTSKASVYVCELKNRWVKALVK